MCIFGIEQKPKAMPTEVCNKADLQAMTSTELHISDMVTYNVMEETSAKGTWEAHEEITWVRLSSKFFLKDQLCNLRMDEGDDIMKHLDISMTCCEWRLRTRWMKKSFYCEVITAVIQCISEPHSCSAIGLFAQGSHARHHFSCQYEPNIRH